jgi:hypothetical protein
MEKSETTPTNVAAAAVVIAAEEEETGGGGGFEMGEAPPAQPPQQSDADDDKNNSSAMPMREALSSSSLANNKRRSMSSNNNNNNSSKLLYTPPSFQTVGWFRQVSCVLRKNALLLWRRPVSLFVMFISSIGSVLLAWARGKNSIDADYFDATQLTQCGTMSNTYTESTLNNIPLTLNEAWRNGLAVTLMGE